MSEEKDKSTEKAEQKTQEQAMEEGREVEEKEESSKEEENDPLKELEAKNSELNDKYLRLYSEFENFRRRTQKEKADLYKTAGEDVMNALLPVIDDFDRAKKSMEEGNEDEKSLQEGMALIHHKLYKALEGKGLEEIQTSAGDEFDVDKHEAITKIPAPEDKLKGKIVDQVEKGYKLNGKVIRYAKVVVGE